MQGFNKYYPPDWVPESGSLNKYNGKHALGDRARKLDKGILIVRFELPYNIWCDNCKSHIGQGVRYNAEKSTVGMYHTTKILNFRCKCHICQHWFEIRTDPENTRYVVHSGARQKNEEWDAAENGAFVLDAKPDPSAAPPDAFASLERSQTQKTRALSAAAQLGALEDLQASRWSDPYAASKALRSSFRKEKKVRVESEGRAEGVRDKYALGDRVRKEDLRTPGVEMRAIEDREWGEARAERERREKVRLGKRRREVEQVGWREEEERTKWELSTSAKRSGKSSSSTAVGRPARPTARGKQPSAALKALAAQLHLTTALKADPFRPGAGVGRTKSSTLDGGVKVIKRSGSG